MFSILTGLGFKSGGGIQRDLQSGPRLPVCRLVLSSIARITYILWLHWSHLKRLISNSFPWGLHEFNNLCGHLSSSNGHGVPWSCCKTHWRVQIHLRLSIPGSKCFHFYRFIFLQLLRCNVDLLKIIQLGLTFFNADGEMPEGVCTWQVSTMSTFAGSNVVEEVFSWSLKLLPFSSP